MDIVNNKGRFRSKEPNGKNFKSFMKESGFYIAIVVGLCALAAGAVYFSTNQILTDPNPGPHLAEEDIPDNGYDIGLSDFEESPFNNLSDQSSIVDDGTNYSEDDPYIGMEEFSTIPGEGDVQANDPEKLVDDEVIQEKESPEEAASNEENSVSTGGTDVGLEDDQATEDVVFAIVRPAFQAPVSGKIQSEYSMDKLVFSPTFNEWRTHSGIDIAAPRGEVVRSIGNGTILEIKNDPRYGFTVVIDHENAYKSIYSNLAQDQTLQVGQEIKMGDPIGAVGATAIFESAEPTHLHFELYKENKLVDPAAYIEFNK